MRTIADYWNGYEPGAPQRSEDEILDRGLLWTQYGPGHGPGDEILGKPKRALELGCGKGDDAAYLALKGVDVTAVDISPAQVDIARRRWGHLDHLAYVEGDAVTYLAATTDTFDAVFSIWAVMWFTDPAATLPLIRERLNPGGVLAFSSAPPVPGAYGPQGMYGDGFAGAELGILRWAYTPDMWHGILRHEGYIDVRADIVPAPTPGNVGTLVVTASKPFS